MVWSAVVMPWFRETMSVRLEVTTRLRRASPSRTRVHPQSGGGTVMRPRVTSQTSTAGHGVVSDQYYYSLAIWWSIVAVRQEELVYINTGAFYKFGNLRSQKLKDMRNLLKTVMVVKCEESNDLLLEPVPIRISNNGAI